MIDLAAERAASLARRAVRDGPELLERRAKRVLSMHWDADERTLRERIRELYPTATKAHASDLVKECQRLQREDRPRVQTHVEWKPDLHLDPQNPRWGQRMASPVRKKPTVQPTPEPERKGRAVDLRRDRKARDQVSALMDRMPGAKPREIRKAALLELGYELTPKQVNKMKWTRKQNGRASGGDAAGEVTRHEGAAVPVPDNGRPAAVRPVNLRWDAHTRADLLRLFRSRLRNDPHLGPTALGRIAMEEKGVVLNTMQAFRLRKEAVGA